MQTLKELKAENARLEEPEIEEAPQAETVEEEGVEAVEVADAELVENAEPTSEEEAETETEAWMQIEEVEQDSDKPEAKFTDSDIGKAKQKLRAKLEKKHNSEVEELRAEIEALKTAPKAAPQPVNTGKPKREDFFDADDPDEAYFDALTDWKLGNQASQNQLKQQEQAQAQQAKAQQDAIKEKVDAHYTKAAELIKQNGISEDVYRQADENVRQVMESVAPNMGDTLTDALISRIGPDSEKVMYYLGRNKTKLLEFEKALRSDPSGIEAAVMLGEVKQNLTAPSKRKSNAPTPAPALNGGSGGNGQEAAWQRKYKEAHKSGNGQKAFNIKREAKKAGVNTREW